MCNCFALHCEKLVYAFANWSQTRHATLQKKKERIEIQSVINAFSISWNVIYSWLWLPFHIILDHFINTFYICYDFLKRKHFFSIHLKIQTLHIYSSREIIYNKQLISIWTNAYRVNVFLEHLYRIYLVNYVYNISMTNLHGSPTLMDCKKMFCYIFIYFFLLNIKTTLHYNLEFFF